MEDSLAQRHDPRHSRRIEISRNPRAVALLLIAGSAMAQIPLTQISNDTFNNSTSQHETEVEPASYAFGTTVVSVFQIGRFTDGGASDIGFSTSTNGGTTWTHGTCPGITKLEGTGTYDRASDPAVIYNSKIQALAGRRR